MISPFLRRAISSPISVLPEAVGPTTTIKADGTFEGGGVLALRPVRRFLRLVAKPMKAAFRDAGLRKVQADACFAVQVIDRHVVDLLLVPLGDLRKLDADIEGLALGMNAHHFSPNRDMKEAGQAELHVEYFGVGRLDKGQERHASGRKVRQDRRLDLWLAPRCPGGFVVPGYL